MFARSTSAGGPTIAVTARNAHRVERIATTETWALLSGKAFYFEGSREETTGAVLAVRLDALCSDCLKSALSASFSRCSALLSLSASRPSPSPSLSLSIRFYAPFRRVRRGRRPRLHRRRNATRARANSSIREDPREADISQYKGERFTAKWIDYSVSRSPKGATIVCPARGETRTMLSRSFALPP